VHVPMEEGSLVPAFFLNYGLHFLHPGVSGDRSLSREHCVAMDPVIFSEDSWPYINRSAPDPVKTCFHALSVSASAESRVFLKPPLPW
jgi:hypothetical protein